MPVRTRIATAFICILVLLLALTPLSGAPALAAPEHASVTVAYTVTVTAPPEAGITVEAVFKNLAAPARLELGTAGQRRDPLQGISNLRFFTANDSPLTHRVTGRGTIEVDGAVGTLVARYAIDLDQVDRARGSNVTEVGGILSGFNAFFVPTEQLLADARTRFVLPAAWSLVSHQRREGEWHVITPDTFTDLRMETRISGWFFGVADFDETRTYPDGFRVRVVGFKGRDYRHWNAYMGVTPREQALRNADDYHAAYLELKRIFGAFPFGEILVVGPDLWQAGSSWEVQALYSDRELPMVTHHLVHAYVGADPGVSPFSLMPDYYGPEGLPTWAEGLLIAPLRGDFNFRGMLYERKIHYERGLNFGNTTVSSNWRSYPLQFVVTYLMDHEIKRQTGGKKDIYSLYAALWQRYRRTDQWAMVSSDQLLAALTELTGQDWRPFYRQNIQRFDAVDTSPLDELKGDFQVFVRQIADYFYGGHPSLYFVNQELVSAAGNFTFGVRFQSPFTTTAPVDLGTFVRAARKHKDLSTGDLTEAEIIAILQSLTGKDHADFFTYYRGQGFTVDPADISEGLRSFSFNEQTSDQTVRLTPRAATLGAPTPITAEVVDPDFAAAPEFSLSVSVYEAPRGLTDLRGLISGEGVCFELDDEYADSKWGSLRRYTFRVPKIVQDGKVYTRFTVSLPADAGVMRFNMGARFPDGTGRGSLMTLPVQQAPVPAQGSAPPAQVVPCSVPATKPAAMDSGNTGPQVPGADAVRLTPAEVTPGRPAAITAELVSPDFAQSQTLRLQLNIYTMPRGVASLRELVTGDGVAFVFDQTGVRGPRGPMTKAIYDLPRHVADGKTYSAFTLNLPEDPGVIDYFLNAGPEEQSSLYQVPLALRTVGATGPPVSNAPGGGQAPTAPATEPAPPPEAPDRGIRVVIDGVEWQFDPDPVIQDGRVLVPMRALFEALGAEVRWEADTGTAVGLLGGTEVRIPIGSTKPTVNGVAKTIDVPAQIIAERTFVPLRFLGEALGYQVGWDASNFAVTVTRAAGR